MGPQTLFRAIFDQQHQLAGVLSPEGIVLEANARALAMAGVTAADVRGRPFWDTVWWSHSPELQARLRAAVAAAAAGERVRFEATHPGPDGKIAIVDFSIRPVTDDDGKVIYLIPEAVDITQQKRLARERRHAQKVEVLGALSSGIAHDYNNLLMGILGCADWALKELPADCPAGIYLHEIRRAAKRGGALTRQLLSFGKRREAAPADVDVDGVIESAARLIRSTLGEQIELRLQLGASTWRVRGDTGQLEQLLMNLVINARDAMPDGGALTIETSEGAVTPDTATTAAQVPGAYVVLTVRDTGAGMDEHTLAHLFEPFFTTKDAGRGTGLGLAMVHAIVTESNGFILVDSTPARGTTFSLWFPRSTAQSATASAEPVPAAGRRGAERVLVVDDDPLVRLAVRGYLEPWGYDVVDACDLSEASLIARRYQGAIDLIITDVALPGATGMQVAQLLAAQHAAPVIYMSAHDADSLRAANRVPPATRPLHKPFDEAELAAELRRALGDEVGTRAAVPATPTRVEPPPRARPARLLLVEDDEFSRLATCELLREYHYDVVDAPDGRQALAACQRLGGAIDAVLTDVGLPDMRGDKLVAEIRALAPDVAVVYVTGRSPHELHDVLDAPHTAFVQKPVEVAMLAQVVRRLVEERVTAAASAGTRGPAPRARAGAPRPWR